MTSPKTLLGPLTTTWTPPGVCSYYMATCDTCTTAFQGQTCNQASKAHDWTDCFPPRGKDYTMGDPGVFMGWGMYSPAYVCPVGFTTVAMATAGGSTGWGIEYSMDAGETAAACCPTGFTCSSIEVSNTYAQTCVLTVTSASFSTVRCDDGSYNNFNLVTFPRTVGGNVQSSFVLFAPLIQLNFKAGDVPSTVTRGTVSTPGASPGASGTGGNTGPTGSAVQSVPLNGGSGSPSGDTAEPSGSSSPQPRLSAGAKAGIGIGAAIGAIVLVVLLILLYRTWQRRRQTKVIAEGEAAREKMWPTPRQPELGGREVLELEGSGPAGIFRSLSRKKKAPAPGPFKAVSPSMARGSAPVEPGFGVPAPPGQPGPFELEADSPVGTPAESTPARSQTPVFVGPNGVSPATPTISRFSRELRRDDV